VDLATLLVEAGGLVTRGGLVAVLGRAAADRAIRDELCAVGRGRFVLPTVAAATATAHGLNAHLSHTSAALHHGWEVLHPPDRPHVVFPRGRRLGASVRDRVHVHRADLTPDQVSGPATSQETTLHHCLTSLPFAEALAVADSALRHGVTPATLQRVARGARGPGAPQARRVAQLARGEAANPFESGLRAVAEDVRGLAVRPQVLVRGSTRRVRPDLVDEDLGLVLEADSFEWHGGRAALCRDARRYNDLVSAGWVVLRFSWEDVVLEPARVRDVLVATVRTVEARTGSGGRADRPA
jgi:very-short-patch-repair endonuclease